MIGQKALALLFLCVIFAGLPAQAGQTERPDLMSFGGGKFEVFDNQPYGPAGDFRLEYRFGLSLLSGADDWFRPIDPWFQIRPFIGIETTTKSQVYGFGGFIYDLLVAEHFVISPNVAVGIYSAGQGKRLGSPIEFRSSVEAGWRFDNDVRITGYLSHISNAHLTSANPGAEMAGLYLHLPTSAFAP